MTKDGVIRAAEIDERRAAERSWNGREYPWIPPVPLAIDPALPLHSDFDIELDPVTYQVLRYRLWNVNLAHSDAIKKVSGAPYVCYLDDFSTSVHTEDGDTVICGPSMVYFVGLADLGVKWALANRSTNPGIRDGDIFMHNDPYIGVTHQNDVAIFAPIFHDGRLFSWVYSAAHQPDVGGSQEGWCPTALDMFQEAPPCPVVRLVEQGTLRRDMLEMFTRRSRVPQMVELQVRGQLAGMEAGRRRIMEMLDEYGPATVKGAMRRMIADTSAAVSKRLMSLPDGESTETWRLSVPGNFGTLFKMTEGLRKEGDLLTFSNAGTDPQVAAGVNGTYATFRSGAIVAASLLLAWDQLYCPAGVLNHLRFEPEVGTLSIAKYPGAVSTQLFTVMGMHQSRTVLSRMMMLGDDDLRARATATTVAQGSMLLPWGMHENGTPSYANFFDSLMGNTAGSPSGDGEDTGGAWFNPTSGGANVEEIEANSPMLYLYRREKPDSGGPGMHRGGNSLDVAEVPHKAQFWWLQTVGNDPSINCSPGFGGGWPAYAGSWLAKDGTGLSAEFEAGRLPGTRAKLDEVVGPLDRVTTRGDRLAGPDGLFVIDTVSSAGYGDPLKRPEQAVLEDVRRGSSTVEAARRLYGVVVSRDAVDHEETASMRHERRRDRVEQAAAPAAAAQRKAQASQVVREVTSALDLVRLDGILHWACTDCGQVLARSDANWRDGAGLIEGAPHHLDSILYEDPSAVFDEGVDFVFRQWVCPSCGQLMSIEAAQRGDAILFDYRVTADADS